MNQAMIQAAMPDPPVKITPAHKAEWNKFLDFINTKGFRGNQDLDKRDQNIGRSLMDEYVKSNPQTVINYDIIKPIQENVLQDWDLMKKITSMKGIKSVNADDRPISAPDGWLGSKTSNGYFPVATTSDPKGQVIKNWGHDLPGYYESILKEQVNKVPVMGTYVNNKK